MGSPLKRVLTWSLIRSLLDLNSQAKQVGSLQHTLGTTPADGGQAGRGIRKGKGVGPHREGEGHRQTQTQAWARCRRWTFSCITEEGSPRERVHRHTHGTKWGFPQTIMGIYVSDIFSACPWTATSHAQFLVLNEDSRNPACPNPQGGWDLWIYQTATVVFPSLHGQGTHVQVQLCFSACWNLSFHRHQESDHGCATCPLAYLPAFSVPREPGWLRARGAERDHALGSAPCALISRAVLQGWAAPGFRKQQCAGTFPVPWPLAETSHCGGAHWRPPSTLRPCYYGNFRVVNKRNKRNKNTKWKK